MLKVLKSICLLFVSISVSAQTATAFEFKSQPYLQNMCTTGVSVFWVTNKSCTSYVLYGESPDVNQKAVASHHGQIDANMPVQKIRLSNLKPGKTYFYKVVSKEIKVYKPYSIKYGDSIVSTTKSFTLPYPAKTKFSFLAFNDVHSLPAYIDTVCMRNPEFDFVCYNGDILDDINEESEIVNSFCAPAAKYFAGSKPFVYTRGNHETRGVGTRALSQYVESPDGEYYYTFMWGNTCFLVLDTGEDKADEHPVYAGLADYDAYRVQQANWMKKVFASSEWKHAKHRIVCGHIPASLQNDGWHGSQDITAKFVPLLNQAKVDMYICGHTHVAKIERPSASHKYTLVIGGGPVWDNRAPGTTFIKVNVDGAKLNVELHTKSGELLDQYSLK